MSKQDKQAIYGQRIRQARKEQHMTREEFADRVGISVTFCANLECGNANQGLNLPKAIENIANAMRPKICRSRP